MEIPAWLYFLVWALIGFISLSLGFYTLDTTNLPKSVPPPVMSLFKNSLENILFLSTVLCYKHHELYIELYECSYICQGLQVISSVIKCISLWTTSSWCFSVKMILYIELDYVFTKGNIITRRHFLILVVSLVPAQFLLPQYVVVFFSVIYLLVIGGDYFISPPQKPSLAFQTVVEIFLSVACGNTVKRSSDAGLMIICLLAILFFFSIESDRGAGIEPVVDAILPVSFPIHVTGARIESVVGIAVAKVKETNLVNFIEFAVGMVGSILFQNFFRLTSFSEVVAFLYLAVAWLTILVLSGTSYDFGVLNFLLGNVVVGCTAGQLGLHSKTWLAYVASLILYGLRLKLQSLTVVRRPNQQSQVVLW